MGILGKLMFWKKGGDLPDIGKGADLGLDTGMGGPGFGQGAGFGGQDNLGLGNSNLGLPPTQTEPGFGQNAQFGTMQAPQGFPPSQPMQPTAPPGFRATPPVPITPQQPIQQEFTMVSKDIELLSYKLDTLKAAIDMVNQRLANIERLATGETNKRRSW